MKKILILDSLLLILVSFGLFGFVQNNHILLEESFENPVHKGFLWRQVSGCCNFSIEQSDSVAKSGKHSMRIELNSVDKMVENGKRSEIATNSEKSMNIERWYSVSIFLPNGYQPDARREILTQWHETPDKSLGEDWRSPPLSLQLVENNWSMSVIWATNPVNTNETISGKKNLDLGPFVTNQWTTFVWHIKFSYQSDGILQIWKNGQLVQDYRGPNYYNDKRGPFFKVGIYKWQWAKEHPTHDQPKKRVLFFDDIRIGDQGANYDIMTSPFKTAGGGSIFDLLKKL